MNYKLINLLNIMNKYILTILLLLFPLTSNAKTLIEEDYADWQLIGTNLVIKNTKIRVIDSFGNNKCGYAAGGNGIAYLITLSAKEKCLNDFGKNIRHEFIHIFDYQNNISHNTKNWPAINGFDDEDEKLAYWFADFMEDKDRVQVFYPEIYNYFNELIR